MTGKGGGSPSFNTEGMFIPKSRSFYEILGCQSPILHSHGATLNQRLEQCLESNLWNLEWGCMAREGTQRVVFLESLASTSCRLSRLRLPWPLNGGHPHDWGMMASMWSPVSSPNQCPMLPTRTLACQSSPSQAESSFMAYVSPRTGLSVYWVEPPNAACGT